MSQPSHPTLINLPQPPSNPDTPEIPGTPTSTTTSLSALSTTAIKDGHRGALNYRGHQHSLSTNSLEAERADRISRLPGLGTVSARGPPGYNFGGGPSGGSPQITPTSTGFPIPQAGRPPPPAVYFDAAGQPTAATKMSTVGTASATEESSSVSGRSRTTTLAGGGGLEDLDGDHDMLTEMDSASASGYVDADAMDEDLASRSVGTFEGDLDRNMSDDEDGNASLVGFGEGAGSTVSGPIYHRRGNIGNLAQQQQTSNTSSSWKNFERSNSGLSETATPATASTARRDAAARLSERERERTTASDRESGDNIPASVNALRERREARMVDGIALPPGSANVGITSAGVVQVSDNNLDDDIFVDTTTSGPVPVQTAQHQHPTSAIRETQQPGSHQHVAQQQQQHAAGLQQARARVQQQQQQQDATSTTAGQRGQTLLSSPAARSVASSTGTGTASREAAERIIREQMDTGAVGNTALGSPPAGGEGLGRFYFEKR